jgi:hypothetical protein
MFLGNKRNSSEFIRKIERKVAISRKLAVHLSPYRAKSKRNAHGRSNLSSGFELYSNFVCLLRG